MPITLGFLQKAKKNLLEINKLGCFFQIELFYDVIKNKKPNEKKIL